MAHRNTDMDVTVDGKRYPPVHYKRYAPKDNDGIVDATNRVFSHEWERHHIGGKDPIVFMNDQG